MLTLMAINIGDYFSLGKKNIGDVAEYKVGNGGILNVVSVVLYNIYVFAGIILLLMVFAGGLGMILNAGNAEKQKQSSQTLSSAVMGFVILFVSYWLIKIIEIVFGLTLIF